jgi:PAS domain S-box-containing protein
MKTKAKTKRPLKASASPAKRGRWISATQLVHLQDKLLEAQETLDAIRNGAVDALVVRGPRGDRVYSLSGADQPYRVYVERMQEGAVTISNEGLIFYANQRFADMVGQPLERVISANVSAYFSVTAWGEIRSLFTGHQEVVKCETILPQRREKSLPVNLTASLLPLEGQAVLCVVVTDLSAQKQNEDLRLAKEVAEKANLAKDTFLAALSHELRTPLNPVLMLASEAAENRELPSRVRADFATICNHIELEARLIDDLLDLTRITHGKLSLAMEPIDGQAILANAVETLKPDLEAKGITVSIAAEQESIVVRGDAVRLQQVFWNVLKNAIKFTPQNGSIKISTRLLPEDRMFVVTISDTGMGMTNEELDHIFETFAQGDHAKARGAHQFGGLGLGLSISKMIMRMHSGDVRAQSGGRGKGATFTIEVPLATPLPGETLEKNAHDKLARQRVTRLPGSMSILLVEDHESTREALTRLLVRRGHVVSVAATAAEARILAEQRSFDLVISDIGLPDENGFDLMKELHRRYNLKGIALTGYGSEQDVISSQSSGFLSHLTKPIRMESLETALGTAMAEIRAALLASR